MKIKILVGIAVIAFIFATASIILFGMFTNPEYSTFFVASFFSLFLLIFGAIHYINADKVEGKQQNAIIIISILLVSGFLTGAVANVKNKYMTTNNVPDTKLTLNNDINNLESQNTMYLNTELQMINQLLVLHENNKAYQQKIASIQSNMTASLLAEEQQKLNDKLKVAQDQLQAQENALRLAQEEALQQIQAAQAAAQQNQQIIQPSTANRGDD